MHFEFLLPHVFQGQAGAVSTDFTAQERHLTAGLSPAGVSAHWDQGQSIDLRKVIKTISLHWCAVMSRQEGLVVKIFTKHFISCRSTNPFSYFEAKL